MLVNHNEPFLRVAADFLRRCADLALVGLVKRTEEVLPRAGVLRPQVILLDLDMPAHAGLDAVPRLRSALPNTGIITLTLSSASAYRQAALAAGADDLVTKSELTSSLLPAIQQAARRRCSPMTPGEAHI
jgi:DNA-binding NarL/FixJ family response regulator